MNRGRSGCDLRPRGLHFAVKFVSLTATACSLPQPNLNTDQILPARYLKWQRSRGLGTVLFADLRFDSAGKERTGFPLNQPAWRDAKFSSPGAISAAGRRANQPYMPFTITAFVA
jgi:hypothetical protein